MQRQLAFLYLSLAVAFFSAAPALAQTIKPLKGLTSIKAGVELTMFNSVVDANHAYPIETLGFFVATASGPATQVAFDLDGAYTPFLQLKSGADCAVSAARVLRRGAQLRVVLATRKGKWIDEKSARITVFELDNTSKGTHGFPDLYFKPVKRVDTSASYCDMNDALDREASSYQ